MIEVFGKKAVTSREFPAVFLDGVGVLMQFTPSLERFYKDQLSILGLTKTEEEIERALVGVSAQVNRLVESNAAWAPDDLFWFRSFFEHLSVSEHDAKKLLPPMKEAFKAVRWVISTEMISICEVLKEKGYRLGVVSNFGHELTEIFRVQGLLDLFDIVSTAGSSEARQKPHPAMFREAAEELDVPPEKVVHVGSSFALDVVGAQRAGMRAVLYDPQMREVKALAETTAESFSKVVSIETIRQNRRLSGVKVISKLEELNSFFL